MKRLSSLLLYLVAATLASAVSAVPAWAQPYPDHQVRIIVPYPPGGGADLLARTIGQKLGTMWGQSVIVENRAGAGGSIGTAYVGRAAPDGYTLLMASPSHAINPAIYRNPGFDPVKDFAAIVLAASGPLVLVVNASSPLKSVAEFIAQAKAHPGSINYASAGVGSSPHLAGELLKSMAGIDITHVPYKGTAPALTDLLGGQVQAMLAPVPTVLEYLKAGKLKALGVTTLKPFAALPEVPPIAKDVPGYEVVQWWGLVGPKAMPHAIVTKVNSDVATVLRSPDMKAKMALIGADPGGEPPQQFDALITSEVVKWSKVSREAHVRAE